MLAPVLFDAGPQHFTCPCWALARSPICSVSGLEHPELLLQRSPGDGKLPHQGSPSPGPTNSTSAISKHWLFGPCGRVG